MDEGLGGLQTPVVGGLIHEKEVLAYKLMYMRGLSYRAWAVAHQPACSGHWSLGTLENVLGSLLTVDDSVEQYWGRSGAPFLGIGLVLR